ncbi:hypothetical protein BESB_051650 [Besnoitia besnoiti]|uniref:Uncharacterized protein n=1 Tax=Besnoitia besnoiti TaxID=94643 RepID=A0A2A9ME92_BESBE|nr:hypothetical protein BESB_051650 [Besnoitia besnoiti]PFH35514.1 hypothetical protein BESB_051650 [Besnoitia besnoiti]
MKRCFAPEVFCGCCCELCQPVRCVIDQHEVEIVPATYRSSSSVSSASYGGHGSDPASVANSYRSPYEATSYRSQTDDPPTSRSTAVSSHTKHAASHGRHQQRISPCHSRSHRGGHISRRDSGKVQGGGGAVKMALFSARDFSLTETCPSADRGMTTSADGFTAGEPFFLFEGSPRHASAWPFPPPGALENSFQGPRTHAGSQHAPSGTAQQPSALEDTSSVELPQGAVAGGAPRSAASRAGPHRRSVAKRVPSLNIQLVLDRRAAQYNQSATLPPAAAVPAAGDSWKEDDLDDSEGPALCSSSASAEPASSPASVVSLPSRCFPRAQVSLSTTAVSPEGGTEGRAPCLRNCERDSDADSARSPSSDATQSEGTASRLLGSSRTSAGGAALRDPRSALSVASARDEKDLCTAGRSERNIRVHALRGTSPRASSRACEASEACTHSPEVAGSCARTAAGHTASTSLRQPEELSPKSLLPTQPSVAEDPDKLSGEHLRRVESVGDINKEFLFVEQTTARSSSSSPQGSEPVSSLTEVEHERLVRLEQQQRVLLHAVRHQERSLIRLAQQREHDTQRWQGGSHHTDSDRFSHCFDGDLSSHGRPSSCWSVATSSQVLRELTSTDSLSFSSFHSSRRGSLLSAKEDGGTGGQLPKGAARVSMFSLAQPMSSCLSRSLEELTASAHGNPRHSAQILQQLRQETHSRSAYIQQQHLRDSLAHDRVVLRARTAVDPQAASPPAALCRRFQEIHEKAGRRGRSDLRHRSEDPVPVPDARSSAGRSDPLFNSTRLRTSLRTNDGKTQLQCPRPNSPAQRSRSGEVDLSVLGEAHFSAGARLVLRERRRPHTAGAAEK